MKPIFPSLPVRDEHIFWRPLGTLENLGAPRQWLADAVTGLLIVAVVVLVAALIF